MLHYSYLFTGPKHPAGPDSFLDLTLNGLNTHLSSTRETFRRKRDVPAVFLVARLWLLIQGNPRLWVTLSPEHSKNACVGLDPTLGQCLQCLPIVKLAFHSLCALGT